MDQKGDPPRVSYSSLAMYHSALICSYVFSASLGLTNPDFEAIDRIYEQFGPIPRLCLEGPLNPQYMEFYAEGLEMALGILRMIPGELRDLVSQSQDLNLNSMSEKICLIRRMDAFEDSNYDVQIFPISHYVRSRLAIHSQELQHCEPGGIYKHFITMEKKATKRKVTEVVRSGEEGEKLEHPTKRRRGPSRAQKQKRTTKQR
jgi:hypothetical protein